MSTKQICSAVFALAAGSMTLAASGTTFGAEKFPSKPIEVVIHAKYGGGSDTTARMMMVGTQRILGVPMRVVIKRGGSGAKAQAYVNSKPRDGHTVLALTPTHLYTMARGRSQLKIDDLIGIARAISDPTFIVVSAKSPFRSLEDLVAAGRKKALTWSIANIGGTEHIGLARLAELSGVKYRAVPFGGGAAMVREVMSGAIDASLPNVSEALTQIGDGRLRALALLSDKRLKDFPNVPTARERGYDVSLFTVRGYAVLKGTPPERVRILSEAFVKGMHSKRFAAFLGQYGLAVDDNVAGQKAWTAQLRKEYREAAAALKKLGLAK
ncbi:MAG TPA: tripartite tricarboxylate transporter substrate binding protein [Alphaproteobacteria bacterium]|nr:tripartite tricarboxylate transporter substrate binding protein [Alphaproteobacteria bacterium]